MTNEKTIEIKQRIHWKTNDWKTNDDKLIFGALVPNLSQFLTVKNNNIYFLTKENKVIWCDHRMYGRIYDRYRNQGSREVPKALEDSRMHIVLNF